jgi:hypothetical protein
MAMTAVIAGNEILTGQVGADPYGHGLLSDVKVDRGFHLV